LLGAQREILQSSRDIRQTVMNNANVQGQPASVQAAANPLNAQLLTEIREGINVLRKEMTQVGQQILSREREAPQIHCPPPPSCVSTTLFFLGSVVHIAIITAVLFLKGSRDNKSKFY